MFHNPFESEKFKITDYSRATKVCTSCKGETDFLSHYGDNGVNCIFCDGWLCPSCAKGPLKWCGKCTKKRPR